MHNISKIIHTCTLLLSVEIQLITTIIIKILLLNEHKASCVPYSLPTLYIHPNFSLISFPYCSVYFLICHCLYCKNHSLFWQKAQMFETQNPVQIDINAAEDNIQPWINSSWEGNEAERGTIGGWGQSHWTAHTVSLFPDTLRHIKVIINGKHF